MKMSRALSFAALALAIAASPALAQGGPPPGAGPGMGGGMGRGPGGPGRGMQMLLQGITLTPAQQTQVDSINAHFMSQMPAMTPGQRPDSTTRAQVRALGVQRDAAVRAVLTPDQQGVWDHNVAEMRARWQARQSQ